MLEKNVATFPDASRQAFTRSCSPKQLLLASSSVVLGRSSFNTVSVQQPGAVRVMPKCLSKSCFLIVFYVLQQGVRQRHQRQGFRHETASEHVMGLQYNTRNGRSSIGRAPLLGRWEFDSLRHVPPLALNGDRLDHSCPLDDQRPPFPITATCRCTFAVYCQLTSTSHVQSPTHLALHQQHQRPLRLVLRQ